MKTIQKDESACADESSPGAFEAFRGGAVPPQAAKICADPTCKKKFFSIRKNQRYCSKACANRMHKLKYIVQQNLNKPCEQCGKDHDHKYGSGRFCSRECKDAFIASTKRGAKNPKVKAHLDKLRSERKIQTNAPYGTWQCSICGTICISRGQLTQHRRKHYQVSIPVCQFCGKTFQTTRQLIGHLRSCKMHPCKAMHDEAYKRAGKTLSAHIKDGSINSSWKNRHHTAASKLKMRKSACQYLSTKHANPCRYNKQSIPILEQIAKEHGWNIQHAENGGEFYTGIGYFVDAYDKEKNIVLEYDEPVHYVDVENNILREKDLKRQQEIIEHLHCEYWRYNETTKCLWKVEL